MKKLLLAFVSLGLLQLCSGQQQYNPPVRWLSGVTAANSGDCNAVGLGAIYEQIGDPATTPTRISACVQTGSSAYAWQPIAYKVGSSTPATCNVGETFFNSSASAGSNWYGCTASNTWTQLGGGGSGNVTAGGTLTSTAIVTGAGGSAIQTPSASATVDSSGNLAATSLSSGTSPPTCTAGTSGLVCLKEGTAPTGAAGAGELYTLTDHFLYTKLNNGAQDKICTLSAGCGGSAGGTRTIQLSIGGVNGNAAGPYYGFAVQTGSLVSAQAVATVWWETNLTSTSTPIISKSFWIPDDFGSSLKVVVMLNDGSGAGGSVQLDYGLVCWVSGSPATATMANTASTGVVAFTTTGNLLQPAATAMGVTGCGAGRQAILQIARNNTAPGGANMAGNLGVVDVKLTYTAAY